MRTIHEVRHQFLERLAHALRRPGMYGSRQQGVQSFLLGLLHDIAYIDQREQELERALENVKARGLWSAIGFAGPFEAKLASVDDFSDQIASIIAEVAHGLGYIELQRALPNDEWLAIRRSPRRTWTARGWRASEILDRFGDPSFAVGGSRASVHCYAGDEGWVFFDYIYSYENDPFLRNVRLPTPQFGRGIVYTPQGQALR